MAIKSSEVEWHTSVIIAKNIKRARQEAGVSQELVATELGLSTAQFQKCESGSNRVSAARLQMIAKILGKEISYFYDDAHTPRLHTEFSSLLTVVKDNPEQYKEIYLLLKGLLHLLC